MKLMIIRHAEPDYVHDSLTEKGRVEAAALAEYLKDKEMTHIYLSPLGRAQKTAAYTLEKLGRTGETLNWMREFSARVRCWEIPEMEAGMPYEYEEDRVKGALAWDILPSYWTTKPEMFDRFGWRDCDLCKHSNMIEKYDEVIAGLDALLEKHGYVREGDLYRVVRSNSDTVTLFCHFGLECVILSRILNISPFVLWHGFCALPSSVTMVNTEERRKGIAYFRMSQFGDLSHLRLANEEPSFHARFCECYEDDTLH